MKAAAEVLELLERRKAPARWGVWCVVTGGVTGHREAWLKHEGKVTTFPTEAEAKETAANLEAMRAAHPRATFTYTACEL